MTDIPNSTLVPQVSGSDAPVVPGDHSPVTPSRTPPWLGVLFAVVMAVVMASVWFLWVIRDEKMFVIDGDGWVVSDNASMCAPGAYPRYYHAKSLALVDLGMVALSVCVLLFCWHLWRVATQSIGLRILAVAVGVLASVGAGVTLVELGVDLWNGFIGFVPHCPPG